MRSVARRRPPWWRAVRCSPPAPHNDSGAAGAGGPITVTAADDACDVSADDGARGQRSTFTVSNSGTKVTEFYLYAADGTRIVGEVENIGPGLSRELIVEAGPGSYSRPRASPAWSATASARTFTVTERRGRARPTAEDASSPTATDEYRAYVSTQADALVAEAQRFADAVQAGDDDGAKALYAAARVALGARSSRWPSRSATSTRRSTPARPTWRPGQKWTGWHRLEKDLWPPTGAQPETRSAAVADQLVTDTHRARRRGRNARRHHPDPDRQRRQGAAGRGRDRQGHRRGGALVAHRPLGLRGERRGRAGRLRGVKPVARRSDPALAETLDPAVRRAEDAARQAPAWATASLLHRAEPGRDQGAGRRGQRAGASRCRQLAGVVEPTADCDRAGRAPTATHPIDPTATASSRRRPARLLGRGRSAARPPSRRRARSGGAARRRHRRGRRRAAERRVPLPRRRTRPASSRRPRTACTSRRSTSPRRPRDELVALLKDWTAAAARMTAGRAAAGVGAAGGPQAPPDDTGEALGPAAVRGSPSPSASARACSGRRRRGPVRPGRPAARGAGRPAALPRRRPRPGRSGGDLVRAGVRRRPAGGRARDPQPRPHRLRHGRGALVAAGLRPDVVDLAPPSPRRATCSASRTARATSRRRTPTRSTKHVWVQRGDGAGWMAGGSYLVARRIRMHIETWDRTSLREQEDIIGRTKGEGAPLSGGTSSPSRTSSDGRGGKPLLADDAHVRLAHPASNAASGCCGAATTSPTARTGSAASTPGCSSSPTSGTRGSASCRCSSAGAQDALNEYIQHAGSALFAVPARRRTRATGGAGRCWRRRASRSRMTLLRRSRRNVTPPQWGARASGASTPGGRARAGRHRRRRQRVRRRAPRATMVRSR